MFISIHFMKIFWPDGGKSTRNRQTRLNYTESKRPKNDR